MKNPHEPQAAAMARAGELPDGEQLRECINSGQVSAAQVVAHQEAAELSLQPESYSEFQDRFIDGTERLPSQRESWEAGYISGGFDEKQKTARIERNRDLWQAQCAAYTAALAAERAEVARLLEALEGAYALAAGYATTYQLNHQLAEVHPTHQAILDKARAALIAPGEKHE